MPFSSTTTRCRLLTTGALIATTAAVAAAPTAASAATRPRVTAVSASVSRCGSFPEVQSVFATTSGGATTASVTFNRRTRGLTISPFVKGVDYWALGAHSLGLTPGRRVTFSVLARGPGGWTRAKRTVRVSLNHICPG